MERPNVDRIRFVAKAKDNTETVKLCVYVVKLEELLTTAYYSCCNGTSVGEEIEKLLEIKF
jgi:hypothetical protein